MTIVLAHGAGAGMDHPWMVKVARAFEARGLSVVRFNFPYKNAGKSVPDRPAVLEAHFAKEWQDAAKSAKGPMIAAGKSMGGRIASQVAAAGGFDPVPRRALAEDHRADALPARDARSVRHAGRNDVAGRVTPVGHAAHRRRWRSLARGLEARERRR
jgi:alpha/beta superfamily hydrolase